MGTAQDKSHKIINYDKQEVALGKKNVKGTCPKDKLEFNFFFNPCIYTSFFRKKIEFCQDDINFVKQRDFWEDTTNLELSTKMQTLRSLVQEFLLRTAGYIV